MPNGHVKSGEVPCTQCTVLYPPPPAISPPHCNSPPPSGGGMATWPRRHMKYSAKENFYKAPKLICTVILWYRFVVQYPPPPKGGNHHFMTVPSPMGGSRPDKRGEIARGGGMSATQTLV